MNIAIRAGTAFGAIASDSLVSRIGQTVIVMTCRIILACIIVPVFILFSHGSSFTTFFLFLRLLAIFHGAASGTGTEILTRLFPMPVER